MAKKKKSFRFRFPWFSEASATRPKDESKSRQKADTSIPIQESSEKAAAKSPPTQHQEVPIDEHQQHSPSNSHQPDKTFSITIESPKHSLSKPESLPSVSSFSISKSPPASQPRSPAHSALERTHEESRATAVESASQAKSPPQQVKEEKLVSEPQPKESPSKTIPKSPEITQPEISSHVTEPVPQPKDSPLKSIPKSLKLTQPESSSHTSSPMSKPFSKPKESTLITIPKSTKTSPKHMKFELDSNREDTQSVLEAQRKFHQNGEIEKVVHEHTEKGKAKDAMTRETEVKLHKEASVSETLTKDSFSKSFQTDWKKQAIGESIERKLMFAASNSNGEEIGVINSVDPMTKSKSIDFHQMDVLSNRERTPLKRGIREDILKFVQKIEIGQPTDPMEDKPVNTITLAGENRGATMQIGSKLTKKEGSVHIHRAYKSDPEESQEVTTDAEEGSNNLIEQDEVGKAYVNSNIQSINNSLMYHGSITEKDPGVQLILPQKPAEPIHSDDEDSKG
ncbi:proteoglycan 4 [Senna tora]|uniref:Proteoglycan 4 n=1 Tax=Senna tora TaxID=362788 RepID=A0A834TXB0_9FABA|nr:proteoglycan 4 [Senna tora]